MNGRLKANGEMRQGKAISYDGTGTSNKGTAKWGEQ